MCLLQTEPYCMLVKDSEQKSGNERYEGYSVDLIESISEILGFNYTIRLVEDGLYGSYDKNTDTWTGMIGELLSQACFISCKLIKVLATFKNMYIYIYIILLYY